MKRKNIILNAIILLIAFKGLSASAQESDTARVRFLFYNVENLFDTRDDSIYDDNEFLPAGSRHWDKSRYNTKLNSLYKVIIASGGWEPPVLAGFCEVENSRVLRDLVNDTWLSKYKYGVVTSGSRDPRGIRTGIIYRKDILHLLYLRSIDPSMMAGNARTRMVFYTKWKIGSDTLHLFLNHWPSRRRGILAEEKTRSGIASIIISITDSLYRVSYGKAKIIIAGDFNCTPADELIKAMTSRLVQGKNCLSNLSEKQCRSGVGSYKFQGTWEMIDQVIVSDGLLAASRGLRTSPEFCSVFSPEFLLEKDPAYPGNTPKPTYRGVKYIGGFSDHLPVILDLIR
ncbi:MAG TPA: hypothetical protein VMT63_05870 [Bacteroidales bacterium]|nr:hypothetical protein [Bacteroidales bacterium]